VKGTVTVDGTAQGGVDVFVYKGTDAKPVAQTFTDSKGKYCWATYGECDGIEPGEYTLTFEYVKKKKKYREDGDDSLNGRYKDPAKSEFKLIVEKGKPQPDVNYVLHSK